MPVWLMLQPAKVATPATAVTGLVVQVRVPVPGLVPMARVTAEVSVVTVLPPASSTVTCGWVAKAVPPVLLPGAAVKATWVAGPVVMLKGLVVSVARVPSVAVRV